MGRPFNGTAFFSIMRFFLYMCIVVFTYFFIFGNILHNIQPITKGTAALIISSIICLTICYVAGYIDGIKKDKDKKNYNNLPKEADKVGQDIIGQDIYEEYLKRAGRHSEIIHEALARADYAHSPFISPYADQYGVVWFNVSVAWDCLSEIRKRIREGLPDTTIEQRLDVE